MTARASAAEMPSGFSQTTWIPRSIAARLCSGWSACGEQTWRTSGRSRSSSSSRLVWIAGSAPGVAMSATSASALARLRPQTPTTVLPRSRIRQPWVRAMPPVPTMAARSGGG